MKPKVLHAGCGRDALPSWLEGYDETRLDIDHRVEPDIVAPMTQLGDIGPFDCVVTQHALEHLAPTQVAVALQEFLRVLKPGGRLAIVVPDLEGVKPDFTVLYESPAGPVCGHDLYYGMAKFSHDNIFMAHRCGFVTDTLRDVLEAVGFKDVELRRIHPFNLLATART